MSNKKPIKLAVLSIIGLLGLAACSKTTEEVYSKPSNYEDPIVSFTDAENVHNNILSVVYDAMHDSSLSSKTLDEVLYLYAESVFGSYNKITLKDGDAITLKDAVISYTKENNIAKINAFIKAHKSYWTYNDDGKHIDADGNVIAEGADWNPNAYEIDHVISKYDAIETRIAEAMFEKINGGSYTVKHYFGESDFLKSLYQDSKKVNYVKNLEKVIIPYTVEGESIFDEFTGFDGNPHTALHREYYQDSASIEVTENTDDLYKACKYTYVEDELIPTIYNDLLVEQYLLDEDIAAVRNSRARKINVIKIEKYSNFSNNADMLVKSLVSEIYANVPTGEHVEFDSEKVEDFGTSLFNKYSVIAKGLYDQIQDAPDDAWAGLPAKTIVENLNNLASDVYESEKITVDTEDIYYYKNTTYGDLVKDYDEVNKVTDYDSMSDTKYSTFTSSGTRTIKEGFEQQKIDIMQSETVTKGWYIQSQTPSLDSNGTINDRLFKLSVANARIEVKEDGTGVEPLDAADRFVLKDGEWKLRTSASDTENKFLCSINGMFFLKFEGQYSGDDWKNDIVYDDGNAYYLVQVIEAAKDSKLRSTSATSYAKTRSQEFMDEVIDEVAKIVGDTGSYTSLSRDHWLKEMSLVYHDQKIYDYFKDNYPDLFN